MQFITKNEIELLKFESNITLKKNIYFNPPAKVLF